MEMTTLSRRNAHRAKNVQNKENPENGVLPFNYYGKISINHRYHSVGEGESAQIVTIPTLGEWNVVEFDHEPLLDEFWDAAGRAYSWNSFDPDKRQEETISRHEKELVGDLTTMPDCHKERYIANYKKYYGATLSALSRCASSAVTGPANFDVRKHQKADDRYQAACKEFWSWREKALKAIEKSIENEKPAEQKQNEELKKAIRDVADSAQTIISIDRGEAPYNRALIVSNLFGRIATYANRGDVEIVQKVIEFVRELNTKHTKPIITERHKFFKLVEVAQAVRDKQEQNANKENKEIPFSGGTIVLNYAEDRLQLLFDEKPDEAMRNKLKREFAFKWSPKFGAWQRKLTQNALYVAKNLLGLQMQ